MASNIWVFAQGAEGAPTSATQELLTKARSLGDSVTAVWQRLLRAQDRFVPLDSSLFLDPAVTSPEYVLRYGDA